MYRHHKGPTDAPTRLIILMHWQDAGKLDGLTHQAIANLFPDPPSRTTIVRDLQKIERIRELIRQLDRQDYSI
jgi:hypothetical protein